MTKCYPNPIRFSSVRRRKVEAAFSGGAITGNGVFRCSRRWGRQLGLTRSVSSRDTWGMHGVRPVGEHHLQDLIKQRVYALGPGTGGLERSRGVAPRSVLADGDLPAVCAAEKF